MRGDRTEIEGEAARWVERMSRAAQDSETAAEFDRWIAGDPRHVESYARLAAIWQSPDLDQALREVSTPSRPRNDNDDPRRHGEDGDKPGTRARAERSAYFAPFGLALRPRLLAPLAASLLGLALLVPLALGLLAPETHYTTPRGQDRSVLLTDGTRIRLSGGTRLSVRLTPWSRTVSMERGEAFFDVAHERIRRFSVDTGSASVTVLGTAFDIDLLAGNGREIRVYRGLVSVAADNGEWRLPAGTRLIVAGGQAHSFHDVRESRPDWIDGWYDAQDTPLARLIEHINRTTAQPIQLSDPSLGELRITGRFRTGKPREMLDTLAAIHGLQWQEADGHYSLSR